MLSTTRRVFHRAGLLDKDVAAADVLEFIEDAQAFVEAKAERIFSPKDSDFNLARSATTDLAAFYTIIRSLGGKYSGLQFDENELDISTQQRSKLEVALRLRNQAEAAMVLLKPKMPVLKARSTTS